MAKLSNNMLNIVGKMIGLVFVLFLSIKPTTTMKKLNLILLTAVLMTLSSCSIVSGIFKAGAYTAIIGVIIFIAIIIWVMSLFRKK